MKRLRTALALLLCLCMALGTCAAAFAAEQEEDELSSSLDAYIAAHADTTAGLAVCVFDRTGMLYDNYVGYADMEKRLPVTEETVFEWGSASKLLVWVSVMQLWEQGLLDLDADIRIYLPEGFLHNLRYDKPVTLLDLMNHRAGFQEMITEIFLPMGEPIPSLEEALKQHEPTQVYEPGTVTAYSNWGTALAAFIVQRVSGEDYCDYVHAHIFAPLGMEHTALAPDLHDNLWVQTQREKLQCYTAEASLIPDCRYSIPLYPAGMVTGTLADFTVFGQALLEENCPLFSKSETTQELFKPSFFYPGTEIPCNCHGFWMEPFAVPVYGHGGNTAGCSSYLLLDRENGLAVTVMTNQSGESVFNEGLPALVFGAYEADERRDLPKGVYRSSRTYLQGPLKLHSVLALKLFSQEDLKHFWVPSDEDANQVYFPYGTLLKQSPFTVAGELLLLLSWALAALYSAGYLLSWPIGALHRRLRGLALKEDPHRALRRWIAAAPLTAVALVAFAVLQIFQFSPLQYYKWCFIGAFLLMLLIPVPLILLLKKPKAGSRGARALNVMSLFSLAALEINILYWQIYAFWAL